MAVSDGASLDSRKRMISAPTFPCLLLRQRRRIPLLCQVGGGRGEDEAEDRDPHAHRVTVGHHLAAAEVAEQVKLFAPPR